MTWTLTSWKLLDDEYGKLMIGIEAINIARANDALTQDVTISHKNVIKRLFT
jgi:hypothetical protein